MSTEAVEVVRRGYQIFAETGEISDEIVAADFVWDMSTFRNWPERQTYEGIDRAREFLADWTSAWTNWRLDLVDLVDAGDEVVAILHQSGTSKTTGLQVDMDFAQLWTVENGKQTYMRMYADPEEALRAASLS